jgi:cell division septation protein DedD
MGYIVGRNSSPTTTDTARNEKPKPDPDADSSDNSDAPPAAADSTPQQPAPQSTAPQITKPAQTQPPAPLPAKPKPEPVHAKEIKPKPSPSPAPVAAPVHAAAAGEPSGGQYWQVVATARPDAEIIAEALGKKGFHAVLAPTPNKDGIFRVLVGPLPDAATQAQTRTGLESAGFKNPIMRKY